MQFSPAIEKFLIRATPVCLYPGRLYWRRRFRPQILRLADQ